MEYLGRGDAQVKVRGYRIELGEIEAALHALADVREAVVLAQGEGADKRLVAYLVGAAGVELEPAALRAQLQQVLPEYMVPTAYVRLEALPLTANGKLDRAALPAVDGSAVASKDYVAPQGPTEAAIAQVWQELLGLERVGRHDHFFELGGHSLLVPVVAHRLAQAGIAVGLIDLFVADTVAGIAERQMRNGLPSAAASEAALPPLIRAGTGGDIRPLFLVHDGSGLLLYAHALAARLDGGVPIYGLHAQSDAGPVLHTMQGMAARMVELMRAVQPQGPYRLAGWSFGGTLAYEIACQLLGADEEVAFLALLDTVHLPATRRRRSWRRNDAQAFLAMLRTAIAAERAPDLPEDFLQTLLDADDAALPEAITQARLRGLLPPMLGAYSDQELVRIVARQQACAAAAQDYNPQPAPVPVFLCRAQEQPADLEMGQWQGWDRLLPTAHLDVATVPGDHFSMLQPGQIELLAKAINARLRSLDAERRSPAARNASDPSDGLITLRHAPTGRPCLLCIPGAGGSVTSFAALIDCLDASIPVYGLQPRGVDGRDIPHTTVEAAAWRFLGAVQRLAPTGVVRILGHSFGGWIGFQLAAWLQEQGIRVQLILLDSEAPEGVAIREYRASQVLEHWREIVEQAHARQLPVDLSGIDPSDDVQVAAALHRGLVAIGALSPKSSPAALHGSLRSFAACLRTRFRPQRPFEGDVLLVTASENDAPGSGAQPGEVAQQWRRWAPALRHRVLPGNHMNLLQAPQVASLAELLFPRSPGES
ncbi:arthrofactin-type cyclic lipopeptide synthetase C [Xanthomonas translucens]|nr:arthrofactin-type cyclic lipopeptide synthetase C [Xanthomonas translucens]